MRHLRQLQLFAALAIAASALPVFAQAPSTVQLNAGMHLITAEVAANDPEREKGLMFRSSLAPNHGMVFVFERKDVHCMWMRNTLIPLSVAFINDDGSIANIEDMEPQTEVSHCAKGEVRFALEMSKGWFARKGVKAGSKLGGLPNVSR